MKQKKQILVIIGNPRYDETTNGLIRQYFPKGSSFDKLTMMDVKRVEHLLNTRPRKCLAYQTPNDIFDPPPPIALAA